MACALKAFSNSALKMLISSWLDDTFHASNLAHYPFSTCYFSYLQKLPPHSGDSLFSRSPCVRSDGQQDLVLLSTVEHQFCQIYLGVLGKFHCFPSCR